MATSAAVRRWVIFVLSTGIAAAVLVNLQFDRSGLDPAIALILGFGVAVVIPMAIRYRLGGQTHALTADEAVLVAMLLVLPPAWPPLVLGAGVAVGNIASRRPAIRTAFNAGIVAVSASFATAAHRQLVGTSGPFSLRALAAMSLAMILYAVVSVLIIAVLFKRLGSSGIRESIHDVLPVTRVTLPANVLAGIGLGWLAFRGAAFAAVGVGLLTAGFAAHRTSVGARRLREQASRLRDVARQLVAGSGSLQAFDEALERVGDLFGATATELFLIDGEHWLVEVGRGRREGSVPSAAASAGPGLAQAATFDAGTPEGGDQGALVAPIIQDGRPIGALVLHGRRGVETWDDADHGVLDGLAGEVLVAMHNAQLVEQIAGERGRLAAQSDLLGGILAAVSDGIALLAADGEILSWNPAMSEIAGDSSTDVIGRHWLDVLGASDEQGATASLVGALAIATRGRTLTRTWQVRSRSGEHRWIRAVLSPTVADGAGAAVLLARDVTATREVDRLKADFLATVSHELRTPLTPIKGFLELEERHTLNEQQSEAMRASMRRQVNRLEGLIDDLLAMAELDRDLVDLAREPIDLAVVVARVMERHDLPERLQSEPGSVIVVGDLEAAVRILDALVDNAVKHTDAAVHISLVERDGRGSILVRDEGPGVPLGDQERIFDRFSRLGDHLLRTQGPGLGLPIARALAHRLDGEVTVESVHGSGATFELSLPLA